MVHKIHYEIDQISQDIKTMGEHVVGRTVQTNQKHLYRPGADSCKCFQCSIYSAWAPCHITKNVPDWQIGTDSCCGGLCRPQPQCVQPDRDECEIGRSSKGEDPLINYGWDMKAPKLKCTYAVDKIDTRSQVTAYKDKFGENSDVEAKYCTQKVSSCPNGMKECSRLKSIGEGGNECRMWFERQPAHIQDATMQNYCLRHKTDDCKCVNRADTTSYQEMKGAHSINDGCWYTACANRSGKYLVPTQLVKPSCPDKLCQVLFDIVRDGNVSINDVQSDIVCQLGDSSKPMPSEPVMPSEFLKRYKYQIMVISIILAILVIAMIRV
ncbi:MAG: hypothetical protein E4H07_09290 [Nitrosomonadales bacterium]|nr:MAG: hypothetical protein E4H07_09290 [Nitrosomonadales bacterium]